MIFMIKVFMKLRLFVYWLTGTVLAGAVVSILASCDLSISPGRRPHIQDSPPPTKQQPMAKRKIQLLYTLDAEESKIEALAFTPKGDRLISGNRLGKLKIWNLEAGKQERVLESHTKGIKALAISVDGKTLVTSDGITAKVWNLETGKLQQSFQVGMPVQISADAKVLVSGWLEGRVRIWDVKTGKVVGIIGSNSPLAISADGKFIVSGDSDNSTTLWNVRDKKFIRFLEKFSGGVYILSPDGQTLVSSSDEGKVKIWNLSTGKVERLLKAGIPLAISPDGLTLASALGTSIQLWNLVSGELLVCLDSNHSVTKATFSADGKLLANAVASALEATTRQEAIQVWQVIP